ncbi:hypothetical protein Sjap_025334 [Stephania japonica]|uniref:Gnk2-homologous domain-containing protein n=1 Tax=Stephania japonica TaxID=461633 RepID=A0AAP0E999_9MAGN
MVPLPPLHLLPFFLLILLQTSLLASTDPLYHICSNLGNYSNTGQFDENYKTLATTLTSKAPPTGFAQGTVGKAQDLVNALALCRGDVPPADCKACVTDATTEVRKRCPYNKGGVIWYDFCELKYSNFDFFGIIDYENRVYLYNTQNVSGDTESFNVKVKKFLRELSGKASESGALYASGEEKIGEGEELYGLVQCTRDLSKEGCRKCLEGAIGEYGNCCDGRRGGRVIGGSCNFSSLSSQVPPTGFALDSTGQGEEVVNGLALCRGDIPSNDCKSCVVEASDEVRKRCEYNKGGVIWYDSCMFKYSNEKFFGTIDYGNRFYMWNLNNVSDVESFNMKTKELLSRLSAKASSSSKLYATEVEEIGEAEKLFGLVQCTRDLTKQQCKKCLDDAIGELNICCDGRRGGRVVGGSCNFRYELYPFFYSAN